MEIRNSIPVTPELPKVLGNEQMHVYAPLASTKNAGIARFDEEFFAMAKDVVGLVRLSATLIKKLEYMHKSISVDGDTDLKDGKNPGLPSKYNDLIDAVSDLYTQVLDLNSTTEDHGGRIEYLETAEQEIRDDITDLENDVGKTDLETIAKNLKGAVNEVNVIAKRAKEHANANETQLISINTQLQGVGRTFVLKDFTEFIDFISGSISVQIYDGINAPYTVSVDKLKTGDNILLIEEDVPDFWFEKTQKASNDTYEYNGVDYSLDAYYQGMVVGVMHILTADYQVIEEHAMSAGKSAEDAKKSAQEAKASAAEAYKAEEALATIEQLLAEYIDDVDVLIGGDE